MISRICALSYLLCIFISGNCLAEKIVWTGEVSADGTPTHPISLNLHQEYQIRVSGYVNLGKWVQNREELANDACYEFTKTTHLSKVAAFRNSSDISVCDGNYHLDHIYQSPPFVAKQNKIHFWVYDTNYEDNSGSFHVQIIQTKDSQKHEQGK